MNKKELNELKELLITVYEYDEEIIKEKNIEELKILLKKKQKEAIRNKKNPNSFFIIKDLPAPKVWETKTSKKGGVWIVIAFVSVMLLFGAMMFWWAFK